MTPRRRTLLLGLLGGLGLLLTLVGIASVTAYAVARRTHEIGVRMAFGANGADVILTMMRDATWPAFAGLLVGMAGVFYATRIIASFLFAHDATRPHDVRRRWHGDDGGGAGRRVDPARRAARVDPIVALRAE